MNISILLKILTALAVITDCPDGVNAVGTQSLALRQSLEMLMRDPANTQQLNQIVAQTVCEDWGTFEEVACFVAACLTQGQAANVPKAAQQFVSLAGKVATQ